ncbi:hypothetical protein SSIN_1846 [Streptococcus sinensis]|uniref:Uncharacterized protein n=1 Tax=Streptococcus sinensis TaxID=176090 RepID=A0A0A0DHF8_9STRE|nr:hypothetical protein SSIN_1846 [Streptococcus sinensis]
MENGGNPDNPHKIRNETALLTPVGYQSELALVSRLHQDKT